MKLRKLTIKNFRGIREMEWNINGDMVCLIGPGDSTKTTILLAMEYLFSPNWTLPVNDIDFYEMTTINPIEITGIITEIPDSLISEDKFGLYLGFWNPQSEQVEEVQKENYKPALQIKLEIGKDLEPKWFVESLQKEGKQPRPISAAERRELGVAKIGNYFDSDLAWGRNSALSRLTNKEDLSQIPYLLADAERQIFQALKEMDFTSLTQAIELAKSSAKILGANAQQDLSAGMDPTRVSVRQGAIVLFDGNIPFSLRGAGSRRLMAMAIHKASVNEGAILLIDEIENSLEPYRIRHLIRQLRPRSGEKHQVIFTTHSLVTVVECQVDELFVVRVKNGKTIVQSVYKTLQSLQIDPQAIVRSVPEAFLSKKVIICEGKTESGFLISLDLHYWQEKHKINATEYAYQTMAESGTMPVDSPKSGGSNAPKYAVALAELGYQVAYFGDSERDLKPSKEEMKQKRIEVILWEENVEIERRLCRDLPMHALKELIELAIELNGNTDSVWNEIYRQISQRHSITRDQRFENLQILNEQDLREYIGLAADQGEWFKRRDKGEKLGELVSRYIDTMQGTLTAKTLQAIENWCYEQRSIQ